MCRHGPRYVHNEGSHELIQLSRPNRTASGLAVYASSGVVPRKTQNSLLAAGQALPDGFAYPQGCYERLLTVSSSFHELCLAQGHPGWNWGILNSFQQTRTAPASKRVS